MSRSGWNTRTTGIKALYSPRLSRSLGQSSRSALPSGNTTGCGEPSTSHRYQAPWVIPMACSPLKAGQVIMLVDRDNPQATRQQRCWESQRSPSCGSGIASRLKVRATPTREGASAYHVVGGLWSGTSSHGVPPVTRNWLVAAKRS